MADPSRRTAREEAADSDLAHEDDRNERAVPKHGPWVWFYGFLHRSVQRRTLLFGGSGVLGLLVLVRQLYAFAALSRWSVLPSWLVAGSAISFSFGLGYYLMYAESVCEECGTPFSKERIDSRPVRRTPDSGGRERIYVRETFECGECGDQTSEPYAYPERQYPRN